MALIKIRSVLKMSWFLTSLSIIRPVDGSGCEEDSYLGWWGLGLWSLIAGYCFLGLYVLCDNYFVPSLSFLGEYMGLSDDVCLVFSIFFG